MCRHTLLFCDVTHFRMSSNLTVTFPNTNKLNLDVKIKFPPPSEEEYNVLGRLDGGRNMDNIQYLVKYRTLRSGHKYGSSGNVSNSGRHCGTLKNPISGMQISYANNEHKYGEVEVEWNGKRVNNYIDCKRVQQAVNVLYKLRTPIFRNEETVITTLTYSPSGEYHNVT